MIKIVDLRFFHCLVGNCSPTPTMKQQPIELSHTKTQQQPHHNHTATSKNRDIGHN
jgi:hypothetical protein